MRRVCAAALALALAATACADEGPPKPVQPDPVAVCEADNARLRAALAELSAVLARLGVAASDAGAQRAAGK